jgi:hypothetical protein
MLDFPSPVSHHFVATVAFFYHRFVALRRNTSSVPIESDHAISVGTTRSVHSGCRRYISDLKPGRVSFNWGSQRVSHGDILEHITVRIVPIPTERCDPPARSYFIPEGPDPPTRSHVHPILTCIFPLHPRDVSDNSTTGPALAKHDRSMPGVTDAEAVNAPTPGALHANR